MCLEPVSIKHYLRGLIIVLVFAIGIHLYDHPSASLSAFVFERLLRYSGAFFVLGWFYNVALAAWVDRKRSGFHNIAGYPLYKGMIWTREEMEKQRLFYEGCEPEGETIVGSANRAKDGTVYVVLEPGRHHHVIQLMHQNKASELFIPGNTTDQGFMTSRNRYISRSEAREMTLQQKPDFKFTHPRHAFSEDLWDTPLSHQHKY